MNEINYIIQMASKAATQTEFLKSIQHNDRFGCITLADGETRWYPELQNGRKVSIFLKEMYKSVKAMEQEDNAAVSEIVEETQEVIESSEESQQKLVAEVTVQSSEDTDLIQRALDNAGYQCEPTQVNLMECFKDYVDAGCWSNLDLDEVNYMIAANELTTNQMCKALIRL